MPQVASSFAPVFFHNAFNTQSDHASSHNIEQNSNESEIIGIRYQPEKHGSLENFRFCSDFPQFEQEYRENLTVLRQLAQNWQIDCGAAFSQLETRLLENPAFFGPMIDTLYGMGKESMDEVVRLFQDDKIPLHTRKNALQNLAQGVTVCSEGTLSNILITTRELALAAGGLSESLQLTKEKAIEQIVTEFVRKKHNPKTVYEIHFVNAYMNALAADFGLREIQDRYASEVILKPEHVKAGYQTVQSTLNTKLVIETLLRPLSEEVESSWQKYKVLKSEEESKPISFEEYSAELFPEEEHTSLHQKIEAALDRMDRKLGNTVGEPHIVKHEDLFSLNDDNLSIHSGTTLAILSLTRFLESKNWLSIIVESPFISPKHTVEIERKNDEIIKKGDLFFIQRAYANSTLKEERFLTTKDLLNLIPSDWFSVSDNRAENGPLVSEAISNTRNIEDLLLLPPKFLSVSNQWQGFFDRLSSEQTSIYIDQHVEALTEIVSSAPQGTLSRGLLTWTLNNSNIAVLERLLGVGVSPNTPLENNNTPLMVAASTGKFDVVEALLAAGANLNEVASDGKTAALMAAENGHALVLDLLLTNDEKSIEKRDQAGNTALMLAATEGKTQAINVLLQHRAIIDSSHRFSRSTTPLMLAAKHGHVNATQLLLKYGAGRERLDDNGNTPLMVAVGAGHPEIVNILLKNGADIDSDVQPHGYTPLMKAAACGEASIAALLLSRGAEVHAKAWDESTALMRAAVNNRGEVVRLLAEHRANLEDEDGEGQTALMMAAEANALSAAKALLNFGAKPNHFGLRKTWHPLTLAAKKGHLEMVKLLLNNGADINARSNLHTAEYYAKKYGHTDVTAFLAQFKQ